MTSSEAPSRHSSTTRGPSFAAGLCSGIEARTAGEEATPRPLTTNGPTIDTIVTMVKSTATVARSRGRAGTCAMPSIRNNAVVIANSAAVDVSVATALGSIDARNPVA
jgi:hypothetical protein